MGSMLGNMTVYHALTQPGDRVMTAPQPFGGHSSNRADGPAGTRGVEIFDIPFDPATLEVDLDKGDTPPTGIARAGCGWARLKSPALA